jgi:AcrR family transcriptional regulator
VTGRSGANGGRARGRRPRVDGADTREAILGAARSMFAAQGFSRTTIRAIAAAAEVDPALVHHYFGTKNDLFIAALALPVDPREVIGSAVAGGLDGAAERLLRAFLSVWDDPELQLQMLAVARGMLDPEGQKLLSDGFLPAVIAPVAASLGVDDPARRMPIVASQMVGLILVRYVLRVEPVASMTPDELVRIYAPTLQRYLTGDLD